MRHLLAVQAQDFRSAPLALRARSKGMTRADVHAALDSGEIVVSWLNRGTLHMVCSEDYWWLHALTAPTTVKANQRRLAEEGVTRVSALSGRIVRALGDGPMLRNEIGERIGVTGQGLAHLLLALSLAGSVVRGPVRGGQQTFVLAADHVGPAPKVERAAALAELGRRYLAGHAAATDADLATWSGLPLRDARAALAAAGDAEAPRAPRRLPPRLLPPFDPYILGWKDRSFAIAPEHVKQVIPGGGMFRAVVLVDGRAAGTWARPGGRIEISPFAELEADLETEIADAERFG